MTSEGTSRRCMWCRWPAVYWIGLQVGKGPDGIIHRLVCEKDFEMYRNASDLAAVGPATGDRPTDLQMRLPV